jgi:uncharacterized membrane protein YdjX (TVP38/TMEM64 family)
MTWRRFYLGLALLMAVIAIARVVTGNLIGAVIPLLLAAVLFSSATDYPLLQRARQLWRIIQRTKGRKGD